MIRRAFIGLGSNIEDRFAYIRQAMLAIKNLAHDDRIVFSSVYETEPVGRTAQNEFLNAVIEIYTNQSPEGLLTSLLAIESNLGRKRTIKWGPRTIDLDILSIEAVVRQRPDLLIPHPELANRRFVLVPFAEIAPDFIVTGLDTTVRTLLQQCPDQSRVELIMTSHALKNQLKEVTS